MNFFKLLYGLLSAEITMTIVIRKNENGRLCVSTSFTTEKGSACDGLVPFLLKGTPEEMDEGFIDALREPAEQVSGLVSNYKEFQASAQQARNSISKKPATAPNAAEKMVKEAEERKREAEERARKEKQRKEDYESLVADASKAESECRFNAAEALLTLAKEHTDDKKAKADLDKRIKNAGDSKMSFICADTAEDGKAAADAFARVKEERDSAQRKEDGAAPAAPAPVAETDAETEEDFAEPAEQEEAGDAGEKNEPEVEQ